MSLRPILAPIALLAVAACAQTPQQRLAAEHAQAVAAENLEQALAGLTPHPTTTCLPRLPTQQVKSYGPTLVYTVGRNLKYRSDTAGGCEGQARGDVLITRSNTGQLCQGDIATTVDPVSRTFTGSCSFGPFVRYDRSAR